MNQRIKNMFLQFTMLNCVRDLINRRDLKYKETLGGWLDNCENPDDKVIIQFFMCSGFMYVVSVLSPLLFIIASLLLIIGPVEWLSVGFSETIAVYVVNFYLVAVKSVFLFYVFVLVPILLLACFDINKIRKTNE